MRSEEISEIVGLAEITGLAKLARSEYQIVKYIALIEEVLKNEDNICPIYEETLKRRLFFWENYCNEIFSS